MCSFTTVCAITYAELSVATTTTDRTCDVSASSTSDTPSASTTFVTQTFNISSVPYAFKTDKSLNGSNLLGIFQTAFDVAANSLASTLPRPHLTIMSVTEVANSTVSGIRTSAVSIKIRISFVTSSFPTPTTTAVLTAATILTNFKAAGATIYTTPAYGSSITAGTPVVVKGTSADIGSLSGSASIAVPVAAVFAVLGAVLVVATIFKMRSNRRTARVAPVTEVESVA